MRIKFRDVTLAILLGVLQLSSVVRSDCNSCDLDTPLLSVVQPTGEVALAEQYTGSAVQVNGCLQKTLSCPGDNYNLFLFNDGGLYPGFEGFANEALQAQSTTATLTVRCYYDGTWSVLQPNGIIVSNVNTITCRAPLPLV